MYDRRHYVRRPTKLLTILFMPLDRMIVGILFLSCLFVCLLSVYLCYNFWILRDRDFIFGTHTPLMTPFQMTPSQWPCDLDFDLEAKNSFLYARLQTGRIMVWWCPSVRVSVRPSVRHSFPHFSPTCFDIFIWNFVYHFIFMHVRSSSNAINFRHFLQELCSFLTSNSYKYAVFRTFLLHALTYWVQILYMTLF